MMFLIISHSFKLSLSIDINFVNIFYYCSKTNYYFLINHPQLIN